MLVAFVWSTETEVMSLLPVHFMSLNGWAACCNEIQLNARQEKYVSICCDSQAALKALQAAKTTSPSVWQCQKALNDISTRHTAKLYWVHGHAEVRGNEIADKLGKDGSIQKFVGPEPSLQVSRQNIRRKIKCWVNNQHLARCEVLVVLRDRFKNWLRSLVRLQRPVFCPSIGHSPGLLLAFCWT